MAKKEKVDMIEILKLLKSAKEAELEAIEQLIFKQDADAQPKEIGKEEDEVAQADDYETMSVKDLYALCCKRGISSKCKSRKKADLIDVLRAADESESDATDNSDEDWGEDTEEKKDYSGMSPKELYAECMERGIKIEKRLSAKKYIAALEENDSEAGDSDEDEDWTID